MRHEDVHLPLIETLESRRLMSTSVFLGGECLPHIPTPTPAPGGDGHQQNPDPNDNGNDSDGGTDNGDGDGGEQQNPDPTPPPVDVVIPQVIGNWSGSHTAPDKSVKGNLALDVRESTPGELSADLDLTGPQHVRWSGQLLYNAKTGHLTMYYLSSNLVAKLDATLSSDGLTPKLAGTVEYFTREGSYTATFSLLHVAAALPAR